MEKKNITLGLVAHVDSGKTTLTEAMLVGAGALRQAGRQAACPASSLQARFRKLTDALA